MGKREQFQCSSGVATQDAQANFVWEGGEARRMSPERYWLIITVIEYSTTQLGRMRSRGYDVSTQGRY
jgi:hypothetical protein